MLDWCLELSRPQHEEVLFAFSLEVDDVPGIVMWAEQVKMIVWALGGLL